MNVGIISLGCAKNQVDSELILGVLQQAGVGITAEITEADAIIVNTCGFIEPAKQETIQTIQEMVQTGKKLLVMGCYAQRYGKELAQMFPQIDRIIPLKDYPKIDKILAETFQDQTLKFGPLSFFNRVLTTSKVSPYVKLSEGCDNRCTYCAIPLIRGNFQSRPIEEVMEECHQLIQNGAKELNLISQDTTRYGSDLNASKQSLLPKLLDDLATKYPEVILRALYFYPDEVSSELLDVMEKHPNIAKYFDIPIQHIANSVLRRMARRGSKEEYIQLFETIRKRMPEAILRTTIIIGFPGETETDFKELLAFIQNHPFERLGAFSYSKEVDTPAYQFEDSIDEDTKSRRMEQLFSLQQRIARTISRRFIHTIQNTLVEQYDPQSHFYYGRSYAFAPDDLDGYIVFQSPKPLQIGTIVPVKIKTILGSDWIGDAL